MHVRINTKIFMHTNIHKHIHTYLLTNIHTYIVTYLSIFKIINMRMNEAHKKTELRADEIIKTFELTYLHKKWAGHPKILL